MDGVIFPRYSVSTPYKINKKPIPPDIIPYRHSLEDSHLQMQYNSSSSSSSGSSSKAYSPPINDSRFSSHSKPSSTSHYKIVRKPVRQQPQQQQLLQHQLLQQQPQQQLQRQYQHQQKHQQKHQQIQPRLQPHVHQQQRQEPKTKSSTRPSSTPSYADIDTSNYTSADNVRLDRARYYSQISPLQTVDLSYTSPVQVMSPTSTKKTKGTPQNTNSIKSSTPLTIASTIALSSTATLTSTITNSTPSTATTFWYPRVDSNVEAFVPLKRGLSKKIRCLLQPKQTQIEQGASNEEEIQEEYRISLKRSSTPDHNEENDPFRVLRYTHNVRLRNDMAPLIIMNIDFNQIDTYVSTVQQRGPLLTPTILSKKFLTRPYKRDLFKLRAIFMWIIQYIRPEYHQQRNDLILLQTQYQIHQQQQQQQPNVEIVSSKSTSTSNNFRRRLSRIAHMDDVSQTNDPNEIALMTAQKLDAMDLLQEEAFISISNLNKLETADYVMERRMCQSSFGMANLFVNMAIAAGFTDAKLVYGYLKAPKDTISKSNPYQKLPINHVWCSVTIEGEYRFIDCWLASPYLPQNENKMEAHWFLTKPKEIIMTHLPKNPLNQYLDPPITSHAFFNLPYVRNPYHQYPFHVLEYQNQLQQPDHNTFYLQLELRGQECIGCFAETEALDGSITKGLAQSYIDQDRQGKRMCKIKAVLPPNQQEGWIKIYMGPKTSPSTTTFNNQSNQNEILLSRNHYPLALCVHVKQQPTTTPQQVPFDFVQLYTDHHTSNEFYIQEPQCWQLYWLQTYRFSIKANRLVYSRASHHHKLAVKSPSGKLFKLVYYPQDETYDSTVKITEAGKWLLICLLRNTGGSYTVANWYCSMPTNDNKIQ